MTAEHKRASTDQSDKGQRDRRPASAKAEEYGFTKNLPDDGVTAAEREYEDYVLAGRDMDSEEPDVLLDVPVVKVDEINLDVEELRARVSLQAQVLALLRLNVGADVFIGQVGLEITGVEAQALLKVRLDNVARILDRVMATIDRNPQILEQITQGVGSAVDDVSGGAGEAVGELGTGAGAAVEDVGQGAGSAVEDVGEGAGEAVEEVGQGAGSAVEDVGEGAGEAVEDTGETAKRTAQDAGRTVSKAAGGGGKATRQTKAAQKARAGGAAKRPGRTRGSRSGKPSRGQSSGPERES